VNVALSPTPSPSAIVAALEQASGGLPVYHSGAGGSTRTSKRFRSGVRGVLRAPASEPRRALGPSWQAGTSRRLALARSSSLRMGSWSGRGALAIYSCSRPGLGTFGCIDRVFVGLVAGLHRRGRAGRGVGSGAATASARPHPCFSTRAQLRGAFFHRLTRRARGAAPHDGSWGVRCSDGAGPHHRDLYEAEGSCPLPQTPLPSCRSRRLSSGRFLASTRSTGFAR